VSALVRVASALVGVVSALVGVASALVRVVSALVGVVSALVGVVSALVGVASALVGVASALVRVASALAWVIHALAKVIHALASPIRASTSPRSARTSGRSPLIRLTRAPRRLTRAPRRLTRAPRRLTRAQRSLPGPPAKAGDVPSRSTRALAPHPPLPLSSASQRRACPPLVGAVPSPIAMPFEPRFATLVDIFKQAVTAYPSHDLFGTKKNGRWTWTTYAQFGSMVDRFRAGLAARGVQRGDNVAIISNNRVEWAVAAYACYSLGAAYVPMYEAQHPKEWEFIVRDCEAKALIVANETVLGKAKALLDSVPSLKLIVLVEGTTNGDGRIVPYKALVESTGKVEAIDPAPEDVAGLIYTSGTTGNPKGVILTHANLASNVSAVYDIFPMEMADRSLSFLPWAHSFGQTVELHCLFSCGASMAICEGVDKILENLSEVKPTLLFSVPRIFNKLYTAVQAQIASKPKPIGLAVREALKITAKERTGERLRVRELAALKLVDKVVFEKVRARFGGRLKYAFSGGAALSRDVAEFIDSLGIVVYEGYGLTETSPIATANVPGARRIGSVGRPIPGVRVEIDDATAEKKPAENGKPARCEGEIVIHGHNVMKGYLKRPEENAAVFTKDGGFRTGDMGYIDALGYVYITGRIKEQYKLENGKYVVPTPLEEQLKLSPYIANVMVHGDNRPYNVALVVANVPAVRSWAKDQQITLPQDGEALLKDERVRALLKKEIDKLGAAFKGFEAVQDFALIASDFTTDNGMLTPSLKLKRRKVVEAYGSVIDGLYAKKRSERRAGAPATA
jgi:long-chain acyl-CoA synthetase